MFATVRAGTPDKSGNTSFTFLCSLAGVGWDLGIEPVYEYYILYYYRKTESCYALTFLRVLLVLFCFCFP